MYKQVVFLLLFLVTLSLKAQQFVDSTHVKPTKFWGFINLYDKGKNIPAIYHATGGFSEGLAAVSNGKNWGYIDVHNKLVIDYQFDYAKSFHHQKAIVQKGEFYGVINKDGEFVIDPTYYDLQLFQLGNEHYYISRDSTFFQGVIDSLGKEVLAHEYSYVMTYKGNLSNENLYKNIPLYSTFPAIDLSKGSFYQQFSQNAFRFSPEKGRHDIYDVHFNKLASRHSANYEDSFQHPELLAIDQFLEENNSLSLTEKRKRIHELLAAIDKSEDTSLLLDTVTVKYHSKNPEDVKGYLAELGIVLFTNDEGKTGLKKGETILIEAIHNSLELFNIPVSHPLEEDISYLQEHFAGAYRTSAKELFDIYCVVTDQGDKADIYSLYGEKVLHLIKSEKTLAGTNKIGFKYRQIDQKSEQYGLVNWAGATVLQAKYDEIALSAHNHLLVKEKNNKNDSVEVQASLFAKTGTNLVPAGLYAEIQPFTTLKNIYLATRLQSLEGGQNNKKPRNKSYEMLRVENNGYAIINQVKALGISTWSLGQQSGMLPFQQEVEDLNSAE